MTSDRNYYKTCREMSGLTQEDAAPALGVSVRRLSAYENSEKVPEDIVKAMARLYKAPLLVWYHLKHHTSFGEFLPDIQLPQTVGDMGFQTIISNDELDRAEEVIKQILHDGRIDAHEICDLQGYRAALKTVTSRLMSAQIYADGVIASLEDADETGAA